MLERVHIRNIVLVEEAVIDFAAGLNVLTGETGAGKSILLDAMGLIFGERSDAGLVRAGAPQASVVAEFMIAGRADIAALLGEHGITIDTELLIRRVVDASGKSRAFINDVAVTVALLKQLALLLVEQHSQHDQRMITDAAMQRDMLDCWADAGKERGACVVAFRALHAARGQRESLLARVAQTERERAFLQFMAEEIGKLSPKEGEEQSLAEARIRMQQHEKAQAHLVDAMQALSQPKDVAGQIRNASRALERITGEQTAEYNVVREQLERSSQDIADACSQLEAWLEQAPDTAQLERSEERLFALRAAARKYHTQVDELAGMLRDARQKLAEMESQEAALSAVEKLIAASQKEYVAAASALSEKRKLAGGQCVKAVLKELAPLKMEKAQLAFMFEPLPEHLWGEAGMERVVCTASTNQGVPMAPLNMVASGGELSRLMLALKVVLRRKDAPGLFVFDEIDTGTGGAVADAIGARLQKLAEGGQVLVVTHAPQVAARGAHHLFISKSSSKGKTTTQIAPLDGQARTDELARMLSGSEITSEARSAAARLLAAAS